MQGSFKPKDRPSLLDFQRTGLDVDLDGVVTLDDAASLRLILDGKRLFLSDLTAQQVTEVGNACRVRLSVRAHHNDGKPAGATDAMILFDVESTSAFLSPEDSLRFFKGRTSEIEKTGHNGYVWQAEPGNDGEWTIEFASELQSAVIGVSIVQLVGKVDFQGRVGAGATATFIKGARQPEETYPSPLTLRIPVAEAGEVITIQLERGYSPLAELQVRCPTWQFFGDQYCVDYGSLQIPQGTLQQCLDLCGSFSGCQAVSRESRESGACYFSKSKTATCEERVDFDAFEVRAPLPPHLPPAARPVLFPRMQPCGQLQACTAPVAGGERALPLDFSGTRNGCFASFDLVLARLRPSAFLCVRCPHHMAVFAVCRFTSNLTCARQKSVLHPRRV